MLYLGRLSRRKGVVLLIEAFGRVAEHVPWDLVIAGAGPDEARLKDLAVGAAWSARVHFAGWVTATPKSFLLQHALCAVVPAREPEAYCLAVVESHAAGRPVIVSAVPGLAERVEAGVTGHVVPPASAEILATTLRTACADLDHLDAMGRAGQRRAAAGDWDAVVTRHLDLYAALVAERRR